MPELPEVESLRRDLLRLLPDLVLVGVEIRYPPIVARPSPEEFCRRVEGRRVLDVGRRGKLLLLRLDSGETAALHRRMTGNLLLTQPTEPVDHHVHAVFRLADGRQLRYRDPRKFGRLALLTPGEMVALDAELGPEPLDPTFDAVAMAEVLRSAPGRGLKALLLDQRRLAGLGNIYVDEALWRAGLHPLRLAGSLAPDEVAALQRAIRSVLEEGIAHRGTSLRDHLDPDGRPGNYQDYLQVVGRVGQPCRRCGAPLARAVVASRGTVYCPACQR
ncbi:MAG TPA: bifunctional DNA-formamidopyrimidine glycosylase/DNA-(apurinic or apyrimidinic site) lyase, partial [Chloroflexota bacterium]